MERGGRKPKSGSKESCASGKELVDPASCPQIKGQHYGVERTAGTNPSPALMYKSTADFSLTVQINHLGLGRQS